MKPFVKQRLAVAIQDVMSIFIFYGCVMTMSHTAYANTINENSNTDLILNTKTPQQLKSDVAFKVDKKHITQLSTITIQAKPADHTNTKTRKEIDRFGIVSAADLLRGIAGVQMGDSRNGGALDVNIRGIQGQGRVPITVDGSQQSLDTYRGYGGTQQRSYIDPDLISQIQIQKGVNSASTPVGGIGGTVAMQTLTAEDIVLPDRNSGFRITGEFLDNSVSPAYRSQIASKGLDLTVIPKNSRGNFLSNSAKSGTLSYANTSEKIDVVAAYAKRKQGNYFAGKHGHERYKIFNSDGNEENSTAMSYAKGDEVLNSSSETESILLKTTLRPVQDHQLELGYRYFNGRYGEIMPSDIFRYGTAGIQQYPLGEISINTFTARYQYHPEQNDFIHLNANLWWNRAKSDQLTGSFYSPSSQLYISDRAWVRMDNERLGGDLSNRFDFNTAYGAFKLNLGAAFQYEDLRPQKNVDISQADIQTNKILRDAYRHEFNLNAQLDYEPNDRLKLWTGLKFSSFEVQDRNQQYSPVREIKKYRQIRAFRHGEWGGTMYWFPDDNGNYTDATDPRLNNGLVTSNSNNPLDGIRYNDYGAVGSEVYDEEESSLVTGFSAPPALNTKDHAVNPSFGIRYQLLPQTAVFASYTMGTRMPALFDTTLGTQQVSPIAGLKSERARSIEIGMSHTIDDLISIGDRTDLKLTYFDNNIKNYINRYYDSRNFGLMTMSNADRYRVNGFEFSAQYLHSQRFADFSATYYVDTETCDAQFAEMLRSTANEYKPTYDTPDCTSGSYMGSYTNTQNPPKFSANLSLGHYFLDRKLTVGSRITYMSGPTEKLDQPWQTGATTPQIEYHPVTLIDAFMNFKLNKHVELNTALQNITNRYYLDALSQSFMPSPGRTFKAGLSIKF